MSGYEAVMIGITFHEQIPYEEQKLDVDFEEADAFLNLLLFGLIKVIGRPQFQIAPTLLIPKNLVVSDATGADMAVFGGFSLQVCVGVLIEFVSQVIGPLMRGQPLRMKTILLFVVFEILDNGVQLGSQFFVECFFVHI